MTDKPHKGQIFNWSRREFDIEAVKKQYGEDVGLGFVVDGIVFAHPNFGNTLGGFFHTSWIVKFDEVTGEIETRNSRYTLVGPERGAALVENRDGKLQ